MTSTPFGRWIVTPYLRPFPIWRYGPIYDHIDGRYLRDGWYPEKFGERRVDRYAVK